MSKTIRAVIFDLDGTLVDSSGEIAEALARAFRDLALPVISKARVEQLIGKGVAVLIERALAEVGARDRDHAEVQARFESRYAETVGTGAVLFPGVEPGLRALRAAALPMSVVTNKPRPFTEMLLGRMGVMDFFGGIVAGDDGIPRKPRGDMLVAACRQMGTAPGETLMMGDSDNDVLAARAAGCPVWCVPYGYNEGKGPETLTCDRLVPTVEEAARQILGTT